MNRYFYRIMNEQYEDFGAYIPDGSHKSTAVNRARGWMRAHGIAEATLEVSSLATGNLLDMILLTL